MKLPFVSRQALEDAIAEGVALHRRLAEAGHRTLELQRSLGQAERRADESAKQLAEERTAHAALVVALREQVAAERLRCDKLTEQVLSLKRSGFDLPVVPGTYAAPELLPSNVLGAVRRIARPHTPLDRELRQYAEMQLAAGVDPDEIAASIGKGANLEELEDGVADVEATELSV